MKFRKEHVIIEATQWHKPGDHPLVKMCYFSEDGRLRWAHGYPPEIDIYACHERPAILTLEGWHEVTPGDWIIKGIKGEFYPCKNDIFEATYEKVVTENVIHEEGGPCPEEGFRCPDENCTGRLKVRRNGDCSCHISAPCKACEESTLICNECGLDVEEIYEND